MSQDRRHFKGSEAAEGLALGVLFRAVWSGETSLGQDPGGGGRQVRGGRAQAEGGAAAEEGE